MKLTQYSLKNGKTYTGYPIDTVGSLISLLAMDKESVTHASFSKSALESTYELRDATFDEVGIVEGYKLSLKQSGEIEAQIRQLKVAKEKSEKQQTVQLIALYEVASKALREGTDVLTVRTLEDVLSESGYKNLFLLQRFGILVVGKNEEILYRDVDGNLTALIEKQSENMASLLNQAQLSREVASVVMRKMAEEAIHETIKYESKNDQNEAKKTKEDSLNFSDIKEKLNEHGFKTLKEFQEKGVLSISEDGEMHFKNVKLNPFLGAIVNNKRLLVDVLNQPLSGAPTLLPLDDVFKEIGKNIRNFLK